MLLRMLRNGGYSKTIARFLLTLSESLNSLKNKFFKCFSYYIFLGLNLFKAGFKVHIFFWHPNANIYTNIFSKVTKCDLHKSVSSASHNIFWVKIQGKEKILIFSYLLIQGSFCKSLGGSLKILDKSVKIWPPKKKRLWHHHDIAYVSKYYIVLLIYSCFQLC